MTLLRGLEDVEKPGTVITLSPSNQWRLAAFFGQGQRRRSWIDRARTRRQGCDRRAMSFQKPSLRALLDASMSLASSRKSGGIVLDMFTECAINDS
jgi:hypothetical protein